MEATALHDFNATEDDELSFRRGMKLKILKFGDGEGDDWYKAELDGKEGIIPKTYIEEDDHSWFLGRMSRQGAENELEKKHNGAYLVRESETQPGEFSLSIKTIRGVQHYRILRSAGKYYLWIMKFPSINELIRHHKSSSVSRTETVLLQDMKPNKLVKALYDFAPTSPEELRFRKGDRIEILEDDDPNWWMGKKLNSEEQGLLPVNYVEVMRR